MNGNPDMIFVHRNDLVGIQSLMLEAHVTFTLVYDESKQKARAEKVMQAGGSAEPRNPCQKRAFEGRGKVWTVSFRCNTVYELTARRYFGYAVTTVKHV